MCEDSHVSFGEVGTGMEDDIQATQLTAAVSNAHASAHTNLEIERASVCRCHVVPTEHYHCLCSMCQGKPVSRKTAYRHYRQHLDQQLQLPLDPDPEVTRSTILPLDSDHQSNTCQQGSNDVVQICEGNDLEDIERDENAAMNEAPELDPGTTWSAVHSDIREALLDLLEVKDKQNLSINGFEAILRWGKQLYCKNDPNLTPLFPTTWQECQQVLSDHGLSDCQVYYICLNKVHSCHYGIMKSTEEACKFCNEPGSIKYYYLGLKNRVRQWAGNSDMCHKMTAHWQERENWIGEDKSSNWGRMLKKEIWDGTRFAELSYFWDPSKSWMLPVRCPTIDCGTIISAVEIKKSPSHMDGCLKDITCPSCYNSFAHAPIIVQGDPRNIAYIGHWDGWHPFQGSCRGCGTIEVSVATMRKSDRNHVEEVYVIGFVPTHLLPSKTPISLDPFLEPMIQEIEEGFIAGINVEYAMPLLGFPSGPMVIRHLLLLWTGDHVAQCEVSKGIFCGQRGCRFCHLTGERRPDSTHYCYSDCRRTAWFPYPSRNIDELVHALDTIDQEERRSIRQQLSKETGFKGTSILHRLNPLYGFDITKDFVIDLQHGLPLNPVKHEFEAFLALMADGNNEELGGMQEGGGRNMKKDLSEQLDMIPWTSELSASRLPRNLNHLGFWKAEDWQKFSFPASEVLLYDKLPDKWFTLWQCLCRLVELSFGDGRDGWTENMSLIFHKLALKHSILVEEVFGKAECRITVHNLIHVSEGVRRFSSPDNYWCYVFERAVAGYVNLPTNGRNIEHTFAAKELRKEFRKFKQDCQHSQNVVFDFSDTKLWTHSLDGAHKAIRHGLPYVLVGALSDVYLDDQDLYGVSVAIPDVPLALLATACVQRCRSFYRQFGTSETGTLYKSGDSAITDVDCNESIVEIRRIFLISIEDRNIYRQVVEVDTYKKIAVQRNLGAAIVETSQSCVFIQAASVGRKVMLVPELCQLERCQSYIVVDHLRKFPIEHPDQVLVPYYPTMNDMVLVQGCDLEPWHGRVVEFDIRHEFVSVAFYVKHRSERDTWVKESRRIDRVHLNSVVGVAKGSWRGETHLAWKEIT